MEDTIQKIQLTNTAWTPEQIKLITNTVAKGATPDELKLFAYTCSRTGLDPLTRQIFFVKRKIKAEDGTYHEQMTIQTGIDGYRAIAERTGELAGIEDATFDSEDKSHPNKATVSVYRLVQGQKVAFTASARWSEYALQGKQAFMWTKMPYLMLAKCAESLALRKAFPNDLSGLYTNEEMGQADVTNEIKKVAGIEDAIPSPESPKTQELICNNCAAVINSMEHSYSLKMFKKSLCRICQQLARKEKTLA